MDCTVSDEVRAAIHAAIALKGAEEEAIRSFRAAQARYFAAARDYLEANHAALEAAGDPKRGTPEWWCFWAAWGEAEQGYQKAVTEHDARPDILVLHRDERAALLSAVRTTAEHAADDCALRRQVAAWPADPTYRAALQGEADACEADLALLSGLIERLAASGGDAGAGAW